MSFFFALLFLALVIAALAPARVRELRRGWHPDHTFSDEADLRRTLDGFYR